MEPLRIAKRHIAWILVVKIGLILLLLGLFFGPSSRPRIDADAVGRQLNLPKR